MSIVNNTRQFLIILYGNESSSHSQNWIKIGPLSYWMPPTKWQILNFLKFFLLSNILQRDWLKLIIIYREEIIRFKIGPWTCRWIFFFQKRIINMYSMLILLIHHPHRLFFVCPPPSSPPWAERTGGPARSIGPHWSLNPLWTWQHTCTGRRAWCAP